MTVKRSAAIGFIFVTLLIDVIGLGIIIPVLPKLIEELIGGGIPEASRYGGLLMAIYGVMQFICSPIIGGLSDKYGRRPVLLASLFGFGIDYIFLALAPTIGWLFVGRFIAGILGGSFTTGAAYIADVSTPEKRAQNFGLIGAAFGLGFIIGPAMGGLLGEFGSRVPFIAAAALSLINWLYGYFVLPESLSIENRREFDWKRANPLGSILQLKKYPLIYGLIAALFLVYLAQYAVQGTWAYYTIEKFKWSEGTIGLSLSFVGVISAIVQGGLIRVIIPKFGERRSLFIGLSFYAIGNLLFALATESWMMFVFSIAYCLGGIAMPSIQGIISTQVKANEQGELQGALTSLMSLAAVFGPWIMTTLFYAFTKDDAPLYLPGAPMLLASLLTLISAGIVAVVFLRDRKKNALHIANDVT